MTPRDMLAGAYAPGRVIQARQVKGKCSPLVIQVEGWIWY